MGASKVALRLCGRDGPVHTAGMPAVPPAGQQRWLAEWLAATCAGWQVTVVSVAVAPSLDRAGVITRWPSRPGWVGHDLVATFRQATGAEQVVVVDDGQAAAVAEAAAAGLDEAVVLTIGTGLGVGVVRAGRPASGGDLAHCLLGVPYAGGPSCPCGRTGCAQAWLAGPAMLGAAIAAAGTPLGWPQWAEAVAAGRMWARRAVTEVAERIAVVAHNAALACAVGTVVVTGRPVVTLPALVDHAATRLDRIARAAGVPELRAGVLGGLAALDGAVLLADSAPGTPSDQTVSSAARLAGSEARL